MSLKKLSIIGISTVMLLNIYINTNVVIAKESQGININQDVNFTIREELDSQAKEDYAKYKESQDNSFSTYSTTYTLSIANSDGTFSNIKTYTSFSDAREDMIKNDSDDAVVLSSTKAGNGVIVMKDGVAITRPYRKDGSSVMTISHSYTSNGYDAFYYETVDESKVKIGLSGAVGNVNMLQVDLIPRIQIKNQSYYAVNSNGDLVHYLYKYSTESLTPGYGGAFSIAKAPDFMIYGKRYYSMDGEHFFSDPELLSFVGTYYPYYKHLTFRSKTTYTADELNNYINSWNKDNSVLNGQGQAFIEAQDSFGVNGTMLLAMAIHESGYGTSSIARDKNNLFGLGAIDSNPYGGANYFDTVEGCILYQADRTISQGYTDAKTDYRYFGSNVGNKNVGMNVKYASDPYWGEKIAGVTYRLDKYFGLKDNNKYQLGISKSTSYVKYEPSTSASSVYKLSTKTYSYPSGIPLLISKDVNELWFKLQADMPMDNAGNAYYEWIYKYWISQVYLQKSEVVLINTPTNGIIDPAVEGIADYIEQGLDEYYFDESNKLHIKGWAYIPGTDFSSSSYITKTLIIENETDTYRIPLNNYLYKQIKDGRDYDYSGYEATINLNDLPIGTYSSKIEIKVNNTIIEKPLINRKSNRLKLNISETRNVEAFSQDEVLKFTIKTIESVNIQDDSLRNEIVKALNLANSIISRDDLTLLTNLNIRNKGISQLIGLEHALNLKQLDISYNPITDLSPLSNLVNIEELFIENSMISDISPLVSLHKLTKLVMDHNNIIDISSLDLMRTNGVFDNKSLIDISNNKIDISEESNALSIIDKLLALGVTIDYSPQGESFRLTGSNRFNTAISISQKGWTSSKAVAVVNGRNFPDALSAIPLANSLDMPILLTEKDSLSEDTKNEILRLGASKVYIFGGSTVVSQKVINQLVNQGLSVERVYGSNRYATAVNIGAKLRENNITDTAIIVNGNSYPDALAISSYAAINNFPILFVQKDTLRSQTQDALNQWNIQNVILVGGTSVISNNVQSQFQKLGINTQRISGANRLETAIKIANKYFANSDEVMITTGYDFPDALSGGPLAAKYDSPIILIKPSGINDSILEYLYNSNSEKVIILGGNKAVSQQIFEDIQNNIND